MTVIEGDQIIADPRGMFSQQKELLAEQDRVLAEQEATLLAMHNSRSWRMTAPLRKAMTWLRK